MKLKSNPKLSDREYGNELSSIEKNLIFQKRDEGYVRIRNKAYGMFYLDPSPFKPTPYNDIYIINPNNFPPLNKFIKVTVPEHDDFIENDPITQMPIKYNLNFVSRWEEGNPNKLIGNRLFNMEEFLDCAALPISNQNLPFDDIKFCIGMYLVASPQLSTIEQGGINTVILGSHEIKNKWQNFKRMTSIIPREFRKATSKNYYKSISTGKIPNASRSEEVNFAFLNKKDTPIHIPMPFEDLKFKGFYKYKDDFQERLPMARAYVLDSLLFTPEIPTKLQRRVEEAMVFMVDEVLAAEDIPCYQDIGSAVTKLTCSFARLNFNMTATLSDLNDGKELWFEAMELSKKQQKGNKGSSKTNYIPTKDQEILFQEIEIRHEAGMLMTIEDIKKDSKVPKDRFEETLIKLKRSGSIYFPKNNLVNLIKK